MKCLACARTFKPTEARKGLYCSLKCLRAPKGAEVWCAKLTPDKVRTMRALAAAGTRNGTIAKMFDVSPSTVSRVTKRRGWNHID